MRDHDRSNFVSARPDGDARGEAAAPPEGPASSDQTATPNELSRRIIEAQEAERSRLAREIHDGPAQALSNAILQVGIIERLLARDPALVGAELRLLGDILRRELAEMRSYISELRPPLLADLGLSGAIADRADHIGGLLGIAVDVDIEPAIRGVPGDADFIVLRVVQEALQNVRKHAEAKHVSIRARQDRDEIAIEIRDDGRGFDPSATVPIGRRTFGVQFMRERAESIGARFEVRSGPNDGTLVRLVIHGGAEETT